MGHTGIARLCFALSGNRTRSPHFKRELSGGSMSHMALFGKTASQWRSEKGIKGKNSNIRDFASAEELVVLINLEDTNADLIRREVPKIERLKILREKAYRQLELLKKNQDTIEALKKNLIEDTETNS